MKCHVMAWHFHLYPLSIFTLCFHHLHHTHAAIVPDEISFGAFAEIGFFNIDYFFLQTTLECEKLF